MSNLSKKPYVEVVDYGLPLLKDRSFLPEIVFGEYRFLPNEEHTSLRLMSKESANAMAREISESLGIEAKLAK